MRDVGRDVDEVAGAGFGDEFDLRPRHADYASGVCFTQLGALVTSAYKGLLRLLDPPIGAAWPLVNGRLAGSSF